jgi:osmotically-inducible protein OsmY
MTTTATLKDVDARTREAVMRQLEADPRVNERDIGVSASDGAVLLSGFIDTYEGKLSAERAAKRVRGVRAVANDLKVTLRLGRTDEDIAHDTVRALRLRHSIPDTVQATVHSGHITLTGTVSYVFQRDVAEDAIRYLPGVVEVINRITVETGSTPRDIKKRITETLHRMADVDARHIDVDVNGSIAVLQGEVSSWAELDAAGIAAAIAPGITRVDNHIRIKPRPLDG